MKLTEQGGLEAARLVFFGGNKVKMKGLGLMAGLLGLLGLSLSAYGQFTLGGINATMGVMSTLQGITANSAALRGAIDQANRRVLRGTTLSNPSPESGGMEPENMGAQQQLGGEPGRSQTGRPPMINPLPEEGELGEVLPNTDVNELTMSGADPFMEEVPNTDLNELTVPGGGLEEEVPNTDVNELTMPGADPFMEEVPNTDLNELTVPGGGLEEEVPNTDVNELTMPGADPFLEEVEGPENGEKVYTAPNGKPFPAHWGAPPAIQTRDLRPLPGGYGMGSGTLAGWIQENLDKDAGNPGGGQVGAQAGEVCQVVLYGTVWCGYCTKTRDLFKAQGVSFLDKDIEKDAGARGEMESKMTKADLKVIGSVPVIDFCGRIMVGYNEGLLLDLIKSQGKK